MIIRFERNGKIKYGWVVEDRVRVIEGNIFKEGDLTVMTGLEVPLKDVKLIAPSEPKQILSLTDFVCDQVTSKSLLGSYGTISVQAPVKDLHYASAIRII